MGDPAFFKNQEQLLSHGDIPLRRDALAIIEAGIASVIPYQATKELIRLEGADIFVSGDRYTKVRNIYVVGVGKVLHYFFAVFHCHGGRFLSVFP